NDGPFTHCARVGPRLLLSSPGKVRATRFPNVTPLCLYGRFLPVTISRPSTQLRKNKGMDMAELAVGQNAPDFQLPRDGGETFKLADHKGKPVVLYFYPQDDTETCTAEAIDFSALKRDFDKAGVVLLGISPDSVARHDKFKK